MNTNGLGFVNWKHARDVLVYNYKSSQTIWKKWLDSCRASLTLWKIYNARSNKLNLTTTQKQKSCSIHLCPLNPSCRQWKGRCWFTCHSFEYNEMMSYFPGGWHSMRHSVPQMVLAMIQLSVAGQHASANKTSYTLQFIFVWQKPAVTTLDMILFSSKWFLWFCLHFCSHQSKTKLLCGGDWTTRVGFTQHEASV